MTNKHYAQLALKGLSGENLGIVTLGIGEPLTNLAHGVRGIMIGVSPSPVGRVRLGFEIPAGVTVERRE